MARSTQEIQNEIIAQKDSEPALSGLNSPSGTAIWRLWTRIVAVAINLHEQFIDNSILEMEQIARDSVAGTPDWLQRRALEFQYSPTDPQVVTVIDGRASYPTIYTDLRIITRASVKEQNNGRTQIKVAKGDTVLSPLTANELNAFKGYIDKIGFAGIPIDTVSLEADRFRFEGEIFYSGEYVQSTVLNDVKTAISNYLSSISINDFDGIVIRENVIDSIQKVSGVVGVDTLNVKMNGRPFQSVLFDQNNVNIVREYETASGYIIEEDTAGNTFSDTITMTLK